MGVSGTADSHGYGQEKPTYVSPTYEVTTHEGLGNWLLTFQPVGVTSGEERRNMEQLKNLVVAGG
jgi:hypothetical protein